MPTTGSHSVQQGGDADINWVELFSTLKRYKMLIIISMLIFTIGAAILAYLSPKVYQANSTIKIASSSTGSGNHQNADFMAMALESLGNNIENEIEILQSRFIATKALENLNIGIRYFTTKHFKTKELYKDSPFVVKSDFMAPNVGGYTFQLFPLDEERFRLVVEPSTKIGLISSIKSLITTIPEEERCSFYKC